MRTVQDLKKLDMTSCSFYTVVFTDNTGYDIFQRFFDSYKNICE